jgi:hypothetical protein
MLVEGLEIPCEDGLALGGAFTTRTVRAASELDALVIVKESITAELVRFDQSVDASDLRFTVVRSRSVTSHVEKKSPNKGFAFFPWGDEEGKAGALDIETKAHNWDE